MNTLTRMSVLLFLASYAIFFAAADETWVIDSQAQWRENIAEQSNLEVKEGVAAPTGKTATFRSSVKTFAEKQSARSIVFDQSPIWQNWESVKNIGPMNLQDAPVALTLTENFSRWVTSAEYIDGKSKPMLDKVTLTF